MEKLDENRKYGRDDEDTDLNDEKDDMEIKELLDNAKEDGVVEEEKSFPLPKGFENVGEDKNGISNDDNAFE